MAELADIYTATFGCSCIGIVNSLYSASSTTKVMYWMLCRTRGSDFMPKNNIKRQQGRWLMKGEWDARKAAACIHVNSALVIPAY